MMIKHDGGNGSYEQLALCHSHSNHHAVAHMLLLRRRVYIITCCGTPQPEVLGYYSMETLQLIELHAHTCQPTGVGALGPWRPVRQLAVDGTFHNTGSIHLPLPLQAQLQEKTGYYLHSLSQKVK